MGGGEAAAPAHVFWAKLSINNKLTLCIASRNSGRDIGLHWASRIVGMKRSDMVSLGDS